MGSLKVLVGIDMQQHHLQAIAAAHPEVEVLYSSDLVFALDPRLDRPAGANPADGNNPLAAFKEAEVLLARRFPHDILERAPKLKWIQMANAGVNWMSEAPVMKSDILLTNASGVAAIPIAEWIVCTMLMFVKRMPQAQRQREERRWRRYGAGELHTKTLGIVGTGHIGSELARRAKSLGMKVLAVRRSSSGPLPPNVDEMYPRESMLDFLAASDFVALCVPLTPETRKLIGEKELRAMKPSAFLHNISRGPVVDEPVLVRALKEHWIAGAALDVFEQEPLPPESELWDLPNVIMTPHASGASEHSLDRITALFVENLQRYATGRELNNLVDKSMGY